MLWGIRPSQLEDNINQFIEDIESKGFMIKECKTHWSSDNKLFVGDILYAEKTKRSLKEPIDLGDITHELGITFKEYLESIDLGYVIQEFVERSGVNFDFKKKQGE